MPRFASRGLTPARAGGEVLAEARQARGLSIAEVSRALKLPHKHLEAIESSSWYELPLGDYGRYFIRAYADFLGVQAEPILERYTEFTQVVPPATHLRPVVEKKHLDRTRTHPLRRGFFGLVVVGLVGYLCFAAWRTFLPPSLTLVTPGGDVTTQNSSLTVSGYTQPGTRVTINSQSIQVSEQGYFSTPLSLTPGLNTITVVAQKSYSKTVTLERQVLFNPPTPTPGLEGLPVVP